MCNQILIASGMLGLVEALLYAQQAGLSAEEVISVVSTGAAASWSLSNYGPRILARNLGPGFYVEHFLKDLKIALEEADRMGLTVMPGTQQAKMCYEMLRNLGHGKLGTHSLVLALEKLNGVEHSQK
jgi:3-hydroxyisobutyrate dehydrogenase